jgi:hypothetical protein
MREIKPSERNDETEYKIKNKQVPVGEYQNMNQESHGKGHDCAENKIADRG